MDVVRQGTLSPSFLSAQAIFEPNFSRINTPRFLKTSHTSYLPAYEDGTECSETSAYEIQTPGNYPEESIQHSEHGESFKSIILLYTYYTFVQLIHKLFI